jgi:hypothetical protein
MQEDSGLRPIIEMLGIEIWGYGVAGEVGDREPGFEFWRD